MPLPDDPSTDITARTADDRLPLCDAVRWACVLEATAPKVGNVHPTAAFDDLRYADFIAAADAIARPMTEPGFPLGRRILRSIRATKQSCETNVNLGIVLLLGPLVHAATIGRHPPTRETLRSGVVGVLDSIGPNCDRDIFAAITLARPGGMGHVKSMDVNGTVSHAASIRRAMTAAKSRDRIAAQYDGGFDDLFSDVIPVLDASIGQTGDVIDGIVTAQIRLIAAAPDSLIARKSGPAVAEQVRQWAAETDPTSITQRRRLDQRLRRDGHRLNPGTTADLIAAGLFAMICCGDLTIT